MRSTHPQVAWHHVVALLALGGCSHAGLHQPTAERPGIDLRGAYGAGTLTPADHAFGRPQAGVSAQASRAEVNLAPYLKAENRGAKQLPTKRMPVYPPAAPLFPESVPPQRPAPQAQTQPATSQTPATAEATKKSAPSDTTRYAVREQKTPGLDQYRGGDVIVITASTLVIILLVVLLVVLLT